MRPPPDKSQYNLFNPTPRRLWREFSTDRPDKTETPFTVDAGRVTMEADRQLTQVGSAHLIETIHGTGYRFNTSDEPK